MRFLRRKVKAGRTGLALGGGAVLGAAHIGVLKAIEERAIPIHFVSGTSIGALVSSLYAFGKSWREIQEITTGLNWLDVSGVSLSKHGLLSNKKLGELVEEHIGDRTMDQADIPVAIVATDLVSGEKVVFKEAGVGMAVMASACIPGIFIPVEHDDRFLVDGGIVENVPVTPLKEMGADFIIGVDLNAEHAHKKPDNIIEVMLRSFDFTLKSATKLQTEEADILIKPNLSSFNMIDIEQADELIGVGYSEAKSALKRIT